MVGLKNSIRNQSFKKSTIKSGKSGYGFEGENVFSIRRLKIQTINKTYTFKQIKNETKANWNKSKSTNFCVLKKWKRQTTTWEKTFVMYKTRHNLEYIKK